MNDKPQITIQTMSNGGLRMIVELSEYAIDTYAQDYILEISREVAKEIAEKVFKQNKKKIISGVNIDLMVGEIEKLVVDKIKNHVKDAKKN